MQLPAMPIVLAVRRSFRWKLLVSLIGSVALLAAITLTVVRRETQRQVVNVEQQAGVRAAEAFEALESRTQALISQISAAFTASMQAAAALEGALEAGDSLMLQQDVMYELEARQITHSIPRALVAFTDARGAPVLTILAGQTLQGDDPAEVRRAAEAVLNTGAKVHGYRLVANELFSVETVVLDLGHPIGTVTVGVPISSEDVAAIGQVIGGEVCFVIRGRCVGGTASKRPEIERAMTSLATSTQSRHEEIGGERWRLSSDRLTDDDDSAWRVIALPLAPVEAPFRRVERALLAGAAGALLLAAVLASVLSRSLTRPVRLLVDATSRVGAGQYDTRVEVDTIDEIGVLGHAFNEMTSGLMLKERYRGVLDKVMSREIAEEVLKGDLMLGGEKRHVTVLFSDIAGFTALTDGMEPTEVIALLNECMERLSAVVEAEGGVVDKYVGDGVMALFGAPVSHGEDALRGVRAGLGMQSAIRDLNAERARRGEPPLHLVVGLNSGVAMAGNMGSSNRLNYTVLGDVVNLASRVQEWAAPGQVVITENTLREMSAEVRTRELGRVELRGFAAPVPLHEVIDVSRDGADEAEARSGSGTTRHGVRSVATLGAVLSGLMAASAQGQGIGELPTLERFYVSSASGWFQLAPSGRLDVEGYVPQDDPPWMIPSTSPFVAPRMRLFADAFFGRRVIASAELRADRGEEGGAGDLSARVEQAFVRVTPVDAISLQVGKFASPMGGYPQRHHTLADPLIRPPLPYEHRTILSATRAPISVVDFLAWKDLPENRRWGAPPIWGAPYPWGTMLMGQHGVFSARAAIVNSSPSSEPADWGWDRGWGAPSYVANVALQPMPWLRVEGSYDSGPWMSEDAVGLDDPDEYVQTIWGAEVIIARGGSKLRGEAFHDVWGVPTVGYDVVDVSWYVEGEQDVGKGVTLAARYGAIGFSTISGSGGVVDPTYRSEYSAPWDYDVERLQLGLAYRLARNAGIKTELSLNGSEGPHHPRSNLFGAQLWWQF